MGNIVICEECGFKQDIEPMCFVDYDGLPMVLSCQVNGRATKRKAWAYLEDKHDSRPDLDDMEDEVSFDRLADELVEKKYQLRIEHNHGTMQWFAYYAGKDQRKLFDDDGDWDTAANTPTQALIALKTKLGESDA